MQLVWMRTEKGAFFNSDGHEGLSAHNFVAPPT